VTQSFNLSQLANNLTSAGLLDASDGLVNAVPLANGGTGATTASSARTNLDVAQAVYSVPSGGIIMWSGSIASIPSGWLLCNGSSGTPDLRDRFVIGSGTNYPVASTGGSANAITVSHTHTFSATTGNQNQNHLHEMNAFLGNLDGSSTGYVGDDSGGGSAGTRNTGENNVNHTHTLSGTTDTTGGSGVNANLPPFYALAFIMKS
jgi:hypothetical protein